MAVTRQRFKNLASKFTNDTFEDFTKSFSFEEKTLTPDGQGGFTSDWSTFVTINKGFVKIESGNKIIRDDHVDSDYPTKFSFEYVAGINNKMRIRYNGEVYNIKSVIPIQEADVWIDVIADKAVAT
jgi:SPP1 family predicted phage head-tail adaptor